VIERWLYLGIVERLLPKKEDHQSGSQHAGRASLRPLYRAAEDFSAWLPIEDSRHEFPNRGFAFWHIPLSLSDSVEEGSLWQIHIKKSLSFKEDDPRQDKFYVADGTSRLALEVIDPWEEERLYNAEIVRRKLVEDGIWLNFIPNSLNYFKVEENTIVGPVRLLQHGDKWSIAVDQLQQNYVREYALTEKSVAKLSINGMPRSFLNPNVQLGPPVRQLDWSPDALVLQQVLCWLSETDANEDTLQLTRSAIDRAVALVQRATAESGEATLHEYRLQRVEGLLSKLQDNQQLAQTLIEDLRGLPFVAAETNKIIEQARQHALAQVSAEMILEKERLEELRLQKTEMETQAAQLERRLAQQAEEIEQQAVAAREALEQAMTQQLAEIMNRPAEALASIAVVRAALNLNAHLSGSSIAQPPPERDGHIQALIHPSIPLQLGQASESKVEILREQRELQALAEAGAAGLCDATTLRTLHAALLSGLLPVLAGVAAYEVLECYAKCAAGGRLLWLPVPATVLDPSDLLGRFNLTSMRFAPQPNGLLDLLLCAQSSEELFIVVLDGVNRAPIDAYLGPLLALYADAWLEPGRRRSLSLVHPSAVEQTAWAAAARLTWPPNVLLAAIWTDGLVSAPPPVSFWDAAALIQVDRDATSPVSARWEAETNLSTAPFAIWQRWRSEGNREAVPTSSEVQKINKRLAGNGFLMSQRRVIACSKLLAAARAWSQSEEDVGMALQDVVACCLAPPLIVSGDTATLDKLVEQVGGAGEELDLRIKRVNLLLS
jgi:hypothetical protein